MASLDRGRYKDLLNVRTVFVKPFFPF